MLSLVEKLSGRRVLVIGDVILDEYLIGRADRMSREAPIPVLEFERRELIPGGAANPAANIVGLGSKAIQVGVIGNDAGSALLCDLFQARGISPAGLVSDLNRPTTTKTRIMAQMGLRFPQQVARIDHIDRASVSGEVEKQIIARIRELSEGVDALMVSDYLIGLLTEPIVSAIREIAAEKKLLTTADAQGKLNKYAEFDLVKCNADEAMRYTRRDLRTDDDFIWAGRTIADDLKLRGCMLITRGPDGATLVHNGFQPVHIRAPHVEDVYDTVGAGDTVLAVVTLALIAGASFADAAMLANAAAGIVVRKVGNYAPTQEELAQAVHEYIRELPKD